MKRLLALFAVALLAGCSKEPDIQGAWYFDYEQNKLTVFPNPQYESARLLIADVEPRYGAISVDGSSLVLGAAVCKLKSVNDPEGLVCDERGQITHLGVYLDGQRLVLKPQDFALPSIVFGRVRQNPYDIYGIGPNAPDVADVQASHERVAEPTPDPASSNFIGYARTRSFNAFYDPESINSEGRNTTVRIILNYLEPQSENGSTAKALSSVQTITFDCPGSNYRLDRYVMFSDANGVGTTISDSGAYFDYKAEMKPVPPDSINQILYMRICR